LGVAYSNQGNYNEAVKYYQRALKIDIKKLGIEHPDVAGDYHNLGVAYSNQGNYDKAIEYYQKAYRIAAKRLGINHPDTKRYKSNLDSMK